jgi:hypothetical protein
MLIHIRHENLFRYLGNLRFLLGIQITDTRSPLGNEVIYGSK